ncbi:MAG: type VI secretion system tip protein TssI/VgrG [Pseudomonadota bacterium]
MEYLTERKFSFTSNALPKDTFAVVNFNGEEGLSRTYRFDIGLVTDNAEIDLDAIMESPVKFTIHRDEGNDVSFSGILATFEQQHAVDDFVFYQATLVPRLWWLSLAYHNQVFLDKSVKEMVEAVLMDGGLTALDFEFRLQGTYEPQLYVCQYGESHLNFIDRWLAREGIYYYFEQTEHGEKIIFTDATIAHRESRYGWDLKFSPPSGLGDAHRTESIQGFVNRQHLLPKSMLLKDYNYEKPSMEMIGHAEVDPKGRGERFVYGEHFKTPEEGSRLAKIRAQELLCRKREFIGESTVPYVSPGFTFVLEGHYRSSFDQKYLTIEMTHAGSQTGYLISGIQKGLSDRERAVDYRNQFTAIPATVQFRGPRTAEQPKITGTLNAKIDAAGSGKYAELDEQGRYKVILPFDMSGRKQGKASAWLRMIQPYGGSDHGMHFPLHKNTEVLLTFIEGNPDRPVIAGAAPNPETPSPVTGADQTMAKITTSSGNKIHMEDKDGSERILMHSPKQGSFVRIGAPNDPEKWEAEGPGTDLSKSGTQTEDSWGIHLFTHKLLDVTAQAKNEIILGEVSETVIGLQTEMVFGGQIEVQLPEKLTYSNVENRLKASVTTAAGDLNQAIATANTVKGEVNTAIGNANTVKGEVNAAIGNANTAKGEVNAAIGNANTAKGEVNAAIGNANTVKGEVNDVIGNANTVKGEVNVAIGNANTVKGEVNEVIASANRTVAEEVKAVLDGTEIYGEDMQLIGVLEIL